MVGIPSICWASLTPRLVRLAGKPRFANPVRVIPERASAFLAGASSGLGSIPKRRPDMAALSTYPRWHSCSRNCSPPELLLEVLRTEGHYTQNEYGKCSQSTLGSTIIEQSPERLCGGTGRKVTANASKRLLLGHRAVCTSSIIPHDQVQSCAHTRCGILAPCAGTARLVIGRDNPQGTIKKYIGHQRRPDKSSLVAGRPLP